MKRLDNPHNFPDVMKPLGYDIRDSDSMINGPFNALYQMAQRVAQLEGQVDTHEKDLYQRVRALEGQVEHLSQFLPD